MRGWFIVSPTHEEEQRQSRDLSFSDQKQFLSFKKWKFCLKRKMLQVHWTVIRPSRPPLTSIFADNSSFILVHGKAVPETGQVSVVEYENPFKRELIWDPVAAGEWTFLGPSEYDSGFRVDLSQILTLRRPATEGNGLRYLVIQERTTVVTLTWFTWSLPLVQFSRIPFRSKD